MPSEQSFIFTSYSVEKFFFNSQFTELKLSSEEVKGSRLIDEVMLSSANLFKSSMAKVSIFLTSSVMIL